MKKGLEDTVRGLLFAKPVGGEDMDLYDDMNDLSMQSPPKVKPPKVGRAVRVAA